MGFTIYVGCVISMDGMCFVGRKGTVSSHCPSVSRLPLPWQDRLERHALADDTRGQRHVTQVHILALPCPVDSLLIWAI